MFPISIFIYMYTCERFISRIGPPILCRQIGRPIVEYINRSHIYECKIGTEAAEFLFWGIFSDFRYSIFVDYLRGGKEWGDR
jgi:hypothetical protein